GARGRLLDAAKRRTEQAAAGETGPVPRPQPLVHRSLVRLVVLELSGDLGSERCKLLQRIAVDPEEAVSVVGLEGDDRQSLLLGIGHHVESAEKVGSELLHASSLVGGRHPAGFLARRYPAGK